MLWCLFVVSAQVCQLYSVDVCVILSGEIHALFGIPVSPSSFDPSVCHHQHGEFLFAWARLLSFPCDCLFPSLPFSSVTLLWRTWWKWLFNHAERSTNLRAQAEWFKDLFRAQLEWEGEGGVMKGKGEMGLCLTALRRRSSLIGYLWSLFTTILVFHMLMYRQRDVWSIQQRGRLQFFSANFRFFWSSVEVDYIFCVM